MKKLLSVLLVIMLSVSLGAAVGSVGLAIVAGLIVLLGFDFLARKKKKASEERSEINQDETDGSKCIFGGPSEPKVVPGAEEEAQQPRATKFFSWVVRAANIISVMIKMVNLALIGLCIFLWFLGAAPHGTGKTHDEDLIEAIIVLALVGFIFGWTDGKEKKRRKTFGIETRLTASGEFHMVVLFFTVLFWL
jgi:hypothetical protein